MGSNLQPPPLPGRQQQVHQHHSIHFHSAIPIKKRRFPIIRLPSPEENIQDSGHESKNKQDSQIPDEKESKSTQESPIDTKYAPSSVNTSDLIANNEVTPTHVESEQAAVETCVSVPQGAKPDVSLNQVGEFRNEKDNISPKEKISLESEAPESSTGPQTTIVKQEIACGPGIPTGPMIVEWSAGQKGPFAVPDSEPKKPVAVCLGPGKLDPSMLSLAVSQENPVGLKISDCTTVGDVGTIRSNWDLNTTMEDWEEGSSKSDSLFSHSFADIGGFIKTSSCDDEKSSFTTAKNVGLCLNKGKQRIPDVHISNSSNANIRLGRQCKIDDSVGLRLDMPHRKHLSLSDYKPKLASVDEAAADDDEKINVLAELIEESFESDCGSWGYPAVGNKAGIRQSCGKEDEDLEEGEVRGPVQHPVIEEGPINFWKNTENLEYVGRESEKLQGSGNEDFDGKDSIKEHHVKSDLNRENISISCKPNCDDGTNNHLLNVSYTMLEGRVDEKIFVSVTLDKQLDLSRRENIEETSAKEISSDKQANVDSGMGVFDFEDAATTDAKKTVQEICPVENNSTLSNMVEASLSGQDAAQDSGNKSRIINLSGASVVTSPCKTRLIPNRLLIPQSGKERYSNLDGEIQPWANREVNYGAGSNKFTKGIVNDQSLWNSRPNFMHGRGRMSGRFSSLHSNEWDSDHDFASETSYNPSNYWTARRKHAPDVETECTGYDIQQDGNNNNRRKTTNEEFHRRLSPGDNSNRNGPPNRGNNQTFRRFRINMSPNGDRFMRHLSDDLMNPVFNHPHAMYDEPDGQLDRGNWKFSNMQRKGYSRICSKSPIRSRTRSPGQWLSPGRRSPNGLQDLPQHRSPGFYRSGRRRSPNRECFRHEMVPRRRGSPSYGARHPNNDLRDMDPIREHVNPRPSRNSNRRGTSGRVLPRNTRTTDALDSQEMRDGDEYMNNGPLQSNKFHGERRNFTERRGPGTVRLFRSGYNCGDGENFRFHMNDGPRPYRFCPDTDSEFVERGDNIRGREFDGRIKHPPMGQSRRNSNVEELQDGNYRSVGQSRRNSNVEELQDGNYRSVERVWHDDGFGDDSGKKRRF